MPLFEVPETKLPSKLLRDKYEVPPFSIIDGKSGYWMSRKQLWESVLKDRTNNVRNIVAKGNTPYCNAYADETAYPGLKSQGSISTFDPFLAEILVKWFSKPRMTVLDPFAGGVVRGAVSSILGRDYIGFDISTEQVQHNKEQFNALKALYALKSNTVWYCDDAENINNYDVQGDLLLTCPPYYNLEIYTDNPEDLSRQKTYAEFINKFYKIIERCYNKLKEDAFAVIVVEEIRNENGIMYGFVPDTIRAFVNAGFQYYNEMIFENRVVSLGVRCPKYFDQSRKVGRHHQNVLVFYKGDTKNIEAKFGGQLM